MIYYWNLKNCRSLRPEDNKFCQSHIKSCRTVTDDRRLFHALERACSIIRLRCNYAFWTWTLICFSKISHTFLLSDQFINFPSTFWSHNTIGIICHMGEGVSMKWNGWTNTGVGEKIERHRGIDHMNIFWENQWVLWAFSRQRPTTVNLDPEATSEWLHSAKAKN